MVNVLGHWIKKEVV